jgi:hypothetical protein
MALNRIIAAATRLAGRPCGAGSLCRKRAGAAPGPADGARVRQTVSVTRQARGGVEPQLGPPARPGLLTSP